MNDRYKEKICPVCAVVHRKRNEYCSKECSNRARVVTDSTKQKLSEKRREYLQTPEGIATLKRTAEMNMNPESNTVSIDEYAVGIPDIPDAYDIPDGYDRGEKW